MSSGLGQPVGILKVRGVKSGLIRETPLLCIPEGDGYILVASRTGLPKHPAWYYNLRANPEIQLFIGGQEKAYVARELKGEERERYWRRASNYSGFAHT